VAGLLATTIFDHAESVKAEKPLFINGFSVLKEEKA
jgi:hypothetical protein